eukprot:GHRR01021449.1.p1 GENE.GHRR01021449.1~~GHRR01021449.1.p1  ORF type:complete len:105 (-),score=17.96 GHRR01021449.1:146-460(-)
MSVSDSCLTFDLPLNYIIEAPAVMCRDTPAKLACLVSFRAAIHCTQGISGVCYATNLMSHAFAARVPHVSPLCSWHILVWLTASLLPIAYLLQLLEVLQFRLQV